MMEIVYAKVRINICAIKNVAFIKSQEDAVKIVIKRMDMLEIAFANIQ
jgi:hypothetical protein